MQRKTWKKRLRQQEILINSVYKLVCRRQQAGLSISAAGQWIYDNYYLLRKQWNHIREYVSWRALSHLPQENHQIRVIMRGSTILQQNTMLEEPTLCQQLRQWQDWSYKELWLMPEVLRLLSIEKIAAYCRLLQQTLAAYAFAERQTKAAMQGKELVPLPTHQAWCSSYAEHLAQLLREQGNIGYVALEQLEQQLQQVGMQLDTVCAQEYENQAANQADMGEAVRALVQVDKADWQELLEQASPAEKVLLQDPEEIYGKMDWDSRTVYQQEISRLAEGLQKPEEQIARWALGLAKKGDTPKTRHIGYYLIGTGRSILTGSKERTAQGAYIAAVLAGSLALNVAAGLWIGSVWAALLLCLPLSPLATAGVQRCMRDKSTRRHVPRMDVSLCQNTPSVLLVIPALVPDIKRGLELLEQLERHSYACRLPRCVFALAGDLLASEKQWLPQDQEIANTLTAAVHHMNRKAGAERFFYLQRQRVWQKPQGQYMGWERKRGALMELNNLIAGNENNYCRRSGILPHIDFVVTLDEDTVLPYGTVAKLVGAAMHPLNRPQVQGGVVVSGYGVIKARETHSLEEVDRTWFSKIFAGEGGISRYAAPVDFYQAKFGESIYMGKGLYDPYVFLQLLGGVLPEHCILSHDLLEGAFVRCGFVPEATLLEPYPEQYLEYTRREHRWIRGDWQLLPFLRKTIQNKRGSRQRNPIPTFAKWEIIDNLRRSLVLPLQLVSLFFATVYGNWRWSLVTLVSLFFPVLLAAGKALVCQRSNGRQVGRTLRANLWQAMFLAHQSYVALDAIVRTLTRLFVTKKNLLEWTTSAAFQRSQATSPCMYQREMWFSSMVALLQLAAAVFQPTYWIWNVGWAVVWLAAPYAAWAVSRRRKPKTETLQPQDQQYLYLLARKMWRYFEDYSLPVTHYLPPDNIQENPPVEPANRTSPTNIGLALLSTLAAWDFGFITKARMVRYLQRIAGTVDRLEKWNGHLYNWYDTRTLDILPPRMISTVDSGNLAGDLLALAQGLREAAQKPLLEEQKLRQGLLAVVTLLEQDGVAVDTGTLDAAAWPRFLERMERQSDDRKNSSWYKPWKQQLRDIQYSQEKDIARKVNQDCLALADWADKRVQEMNFQPLYDSKRKLFAIGYQVEEGQCTPSYYDQLASEARQTSFVAVAKGDVPAEHWQQLARVQIGNGGKNGLASWSGTMFEYYMPRLLMRSVPDSIFSHTYGYVLECQKQYAREHGIPWGMSESAYAKFDQQWHYQYYAFGDAKLALKSGQGTEPVIAPYATQLALMEDAQGALQNLKWLKKLGACGRYGFYESVDWTPRRQLRGQMHTVVKSYMVHHIGMGLMAIHDVLQSHLMQERFLRDARIASVDYLQQERMVEMVKQPNHMPELAKPSVKMEFQEAASMRTVPAARQDVPDVQLLSNSMFSTLVDSSGGGYTRAGDVMLTRFRTLGGSPPYGTFFYVQEQKQKVWSPAPFPVGNAQMLQTVFQSHMVRFQACANGIASTYEITVSPEEPVEVRKLTLQNEADQERTLEITSYVEPCMMRQQADVAHMAFGKLFVHTQYEQEQHMLLAERRPREPEEQPLFLFHKLCAPDAVRHVTFETSRERFIGRCRSLRNPAAMEQPLSGTQGAAIDPCLALRCEVQLPAKKTVTLYYVTGSVRDREEVRRIARASQYQVSLQTVFERSLERSNVVRTHLHWQEEEESLAMQLLPQVLYPIPQKQFYSPKEKNKLGQAALWRMGISGDFPIVLCRIAGQAQLPQVLLKIHIFWHLRGFSCDLIFLLEQTGETADAQEQQLRDWARQTHSQEQMQRPGGIYICRTETLEAGEEQLLHTAARIVLDGGKPLAMQLELPEEPLQIPPQQLPGGAMERERPSLKFWNGYGGFDEASAEYVIDLKDEQNTPLPWVNVIAGKKLGFLAGDSGSGFTYAYNSREYKLTPWSNDFVTDPPGEWFSIRDCGKGNSWSVTHQPLRSAGPYQIRHGFGYTVYRHDAYGITGELTVFAAVNQPVKLSILKLGNRDEQVRSLEICYHVIPVLGVSEEETGWYLQARLEPELGLVHNTYPSAMPEQELFISAPGTTAGEKRHKRCLCLTLTKRVELQPGETATLPYVMGCGDSTQGRLLLREQAWKKEWQRVQAFWKEVLGKVRVETPDEGINFLVNGRLLYQTYAARMLARSGFYQTSGAFGFRDQLQDSLAMLYGNEELCKKQILKHASKQFEEGDVQHWWHDSLEGDTATSRGIRTKFSDDLVWLAYVTAQYVKKTGDTSLLQQQAPFLYDVPLDKEAERYGLATVSGKKADIYTHCKLALDRALHYGNHGLPLMGSGDWNDGMNRVGSQGKGESVWLGFFLVKTLQDFLPLCQARWDTEAESRYRAELEHLQQALRQHAWDGRWFLRAYFDDGKPLGSHQNEECKIDVIAQSWAVISGVASAEKAWEAMTQADNYLVDREHQLIRLLTPAFDKAPVDPGYIKSYLPGVRENGGQYTHGAIWYAWAWALLGNREKTAEMVQLLSPINHGRTQEEIGRYRAEPYAVAADIYTAQGQQGRGGWSWYTGAAGWMYSLLLEMVLGFHKEGNLLCIRPVVPQEWESFRMKYSYGSAIYDITVVNKAGKAEPIRLQDDGKTHHITVYVGEQKTRGNQE